MPVRPRKRVVQVEFRPPMPGDLVSYRPGEWGAPPWCGSGAEWEAGHRAAYQRWLQAHNEWMDQHKHMPVDPSLAPAGDAPWCGVFDEHECGGADCSQRPVHTIVGHYCDH